MQLKYMGREIEIDEVDAPILDMRTWIFQKSAQNQSRWYLAASIGGSKVYLHRMLLKPPPGMTVDHINGNGLDNRRCNLRVASRSQNNANRAIAISKSGFKGVEKTPEGKFRAHISAPMSERSTHKKMHLGIYARAEDAARAYDDAAIKRWGDFARLNFPTKGIAQNV